MPDDPSSVTVYTSWRGLASAVASPLVLVGLGGYLMTATGPGVVALVLLVLGSGLGAVTLWDYPRRARFTAAGIERVCFLRRQLLPWDQVVALERPRPPVLSQVKVRGSDQALRPPSGGLVARGAGRRRYLLTDRIESQREFDAIQQVLAVAHAPTTVRAARPVGDAPPTDLYRRGSSLPRDEGDGA